MATVVMNLRRQADLVAALDALCLAEGGNHTRPDEAIAQAFRLVTGNAQRAAVTALKAGLQSEIATGKRVLLEDLKR